MDADAAVVRWRRAHRHGWTLWHVDVPVPSDAHGRTACGRRYKRRDAETGTAADGVLCRGCLRALAGTVPGEPAT